MTLQHVRILATLQMIQGALECVGGLIFAVSPGGTDGGSVAVWLALSLLGLGVVVGGVLRIVAGLRNVSYRGRDLGMYALAIGLLSGITCCCLPTSAALGIYGFMVY